MARPSRQPWFDPAPELPREARWRAWMGRVEAVIFASPTPVPRETLAALVGPECRLDALIADIQDELRAPTSSPSLPAAGTIAPGQPTATPSAPPAVLAKRRARRRSRRPKTSSSLGSLRDLPDIEALEDAGLLARGAPVAPQPDALDDVLGVRPDDTDPRG